MPVDTSTATAESATTEQSPSPSSDQGSHQPEPVSISTSQSKFAGLASRFFGRPVRVEGAEEETEQGEGQDDKPGAGDRNASEPEKVTLTRDELKRMVQSEKDKELARERKAQSDQAEAARLEKLKKDDPYAYIEHEDQAKATGEFVASIARHYDQAFLDPIKDRLSERDRKALLGDKGVAGMDGRKEFVSKALDILLKEAEAKGAKAAEKKLRSNPAAMKQVLLGERERGDEPEIDEGAGVPAPSKLDMNALIRRSFGR